jgi:dolichol-phosphate mannosyltransferase
VRGDKILRVLIPALNLDSATVDFKPEPRISGSSRYRLKHQVNIALTSILAFSSKPLRLTGMLGATISLASLLWLIYVLAIYLQNGSVAGWTSVMFAVLFLGGLNLFAISLVGLYVSQAHDMLMNRPRFSIDKIWTSKLQDQRSPLD